jgi:hypothetical protein
MTENKLNFSALKTNNAEKIEVKKEILPPEKIKEIKKVEIKTKPIVQVSL